MSREPCKAVAALVLAFICAGAGCTCTEKPRQGPTPAPAKQAAAKKQQQKLGALPYVDWVPVKAADRGKSSITRHLEGESDPGLNFFNSRPRHEAVLMNMAGKVLHRWKSDRDQPGPEEQAWSLVWGHFDFKGWHHSEVRPDGSVLAIVHYRSLLKLDWNSKVVFSARVAAHHDLDVADNGDIYVLDAAPRMIRYGKKERLFLDNGVVVLSPDGKQKARHSLYEIFNRAPETRRKLQGVLRAAMRVYDDSLKAGYRTASKLTNPLALSTMAAQLRNILDGKFVGSRRTKLMFLTQLYPIDLFHANSLEILREGRAGLWKKGDLLLSLRSLNVVLIVDLQAGRVRWLWGQDQLVRQHHPSLVKGGKVLLFDNGTETTGSRVIEVDPATNEIGWTYRGKTPEDFFSVIRGGVQRLPGGNTLITDSEKGRALEVTRAGKVVWEFYNPDMSLVHIVLLRAPIYRVMRYPAGMFEGLLSGGR